MTDRTALKAPRVSAGSDARFYDAAAPRVKGLPWLPTLYAGNRHC